MSENPENPFESLLSGFSLGPAWARPKDESSKDTPRQHREYKPDRRDNRDNRDNRDRSQNRSNNRDNRRDFNKNDRQDTRREEITPAEGVNVTLLPDLHSIQLICKQIQKDVRVYSLYDVAENILAERSRTTATFEISAKKEPFFHCKIDNALFLTKQEALQHLLTAPWRNQFIEESTVEVEPPKGNFQAIAKCGISGTLLGPPNYHAYQTEIRRVHREQFSHMPFDSYVAKIQTERSEEAVNAWLETMKNQTRWRIIQDSDIQGRDGSPQPSISDAPPTEETPTPPEDSLPEEPTEESTPPQPTPDPAINWLTDRTQLEHAISSQILDQAFDRTRKAVLPSNIPAKLISPGLLIRLKNTGNHHRKHPAILIPAVCKILEAEHMPVFKRQGKLFTGPARPHALDPDAVLAPRPAEMVKFIRENKPAKLEGLWKAVLPEGATAPPADYAADLYWLLQQGHILLHIDDTLVLQEPKPTPPPPDKNKVRTASKPKTPKTKLTEQSEPSEPSEPEPSVLSDISVLSEPEPEPDPQPEPQPEPQPDPQPEPQPPVPTEEPEKPLP